MIGPPQLGNGSRCLISGTASGSHYRVAWRATFGFHPHPVRRYGVRTPNCLIYVCIVIAHLCIHYSSRNLFTVLLSFSQFFSSSPWRLIAFPAKLCLARNVVGLHPVWVRSRCLVGCSVGLVLRGGWLDTPFGPGPQVPSVR